MKSSEFEANVDLLKMIGVESFDIFEKEDLEFLTNEENHGEEFNDNLAGHIKKEIKIPKWPDLFEKKIMYGITQSHIMSDTIDRVVVNTQNSQLKLHRLWINYQKKHEFNPMHRHTGVLSFIIFIKIPYELADEDAVFNANGKYNSRLQFVTTAPDGQIVGTYVNVDKTYEGKMVMFSSK